MRRKLAKAIKWLIDGFDDLLGIGGLDTADYVEQVEHRFQITLTDADQSSAGTLGDLESLINDCRRAVDLPPIEQGELWSQLLAMTADYFGVEEHDLSRETRFVEDLGA